MRKFRVKWCRKSISAIVKNIANRLELRMLRALATRYRTKWRELEIEY